MPKIQLLSEDLINKIAAGEVIERPASVVKELMENSLDAKATSIIIEIENYGKDLISVRDNGEGMDETDARNSMVRHATSKIKDVQDLFSIHTLGFRGEALASIAAVSTMSITTKQQGRMEGFQITMEAGRIIQEGIIGAEEGTTIQIKNLFFNTPARKKFLKTDSVELRHIIDVIQRYALINHQVSFRLLHQGNELINSPSMADLRSKVASIYGIKAAKEMLGVQYDHEGIRIYGLVGKPSQSRNDKSQQAIFVNKRWIKNEDISTAVYDAYHSLLFVNTHPLLVLGLELDPARIDVNVHPTKSEIKIEQKEAVVNAVFTAIKEALQSHNLTPTVEMEEQLTFGTPRRTLPKTGIKYAFDSSAQAVFTVNESSSGSEYASAEEVSIAPEQGFPEDIPATVAFPALKILGQVHKTFFVAETAGGVFFIDQHAAHERVLYEQFLEQYMTQRIEVQQLLQGEVLECTPTERMLIIEHKMALEQLGFRVEDFGQNTFVVKSVPLILGRQQPQAMVYEIIALLREGKQKLQDRKEEIITRMACRAAVMAGDTLTNIQMEDIVRDLATKKDPYTCPHGRPTMIKTQAEELEKKFKRK
ncbi:TPA: DNA mismatch repair endonuclease MutL [Candidatus Woesearchaeota archaeon]|nr:DNA mismatch repair endonuclease MutL [Candidatus Woesearchaeota archaeon]HIG93443.1 DNA mismatch repair endonuclease MutL [Candidatus Woesearchaeota archaeon]